MIVSLVERQVHVGLGDRADAAVDDPQVDLLADVQLEQRVLEGLDRTGDVALDDEVELLDVARLRGPCPGPPARRAPGGGTAARCAPWPTRRSAICRATRSSSTTRKVSPAPGTDGQTEHLHRTGGIGLLDVVAVLVEHGAHAAVRVADHHRVAHAQRAALDQDGRHGAAAAVQVRLDRDALRVLVRVRLQVQGRVRGQYDRLEQVLDADVLPRGDVDEHGVAAVVLRHQAVLGELAADLEPGPRPPCRSC